MYNMKLMVLTLNIAKLKNAPYKKIFTFIKDNHCKSGSD